MWKSAAGQTVKVQANTDNDDWDTDPDFVNDVSEKEQRKGAKTIDGSIKPKDSVDVSQLRSQVVNKNEEASKKEYNSKGTFAAGYGGKFGVQTDRMDKSAVGFDSKSELSQHQSVPKYQKPSVVSAPASSIKSKFEQLGSGADAEKLQQEKIASERAARAEKDRQERERVKKEQEEQDRKAKIAREAEEQRAREQREAERAAAPPQPTYSSLPAHRQPAYEEEPVAEAQYEEPQQEYEEPQQQYEEPQQQYEEPQQEYEEPQQTEEPAAQAAGFSATAIYEYEAGGEDELPFNEGDVITNIEVIDEGWWRGECNGKYGLFPSNYVQA